MIMIFLNIVQKLNIIAVSVRQMTDSELQRQFYTNFLLLLCCAFIVVYDTADVAAWLFAKWDISLNK